jgi:hypothetical protein
MKISRRPMFTTIIYGLLAGISFIPTVMAFSSVMEWTAAFRMAMWLVLAGYLVILTRWGRVNLLSIAFPLILLLFLVFWGDTHSGFLILALGVLAWVRSGVCFQRGLLKPLTAEVFLCCGAGALVAFFTPHSTITWGVAVWLFFLVQSVYFVFFADFAETQEQQAQRDPFHQARTRAERILSSGS